MLLVVSSIALGACSRAAPPVHVASTHAAQTVAGGVMLVLPPRICLDIQIDDVRHGRAGERGLVRTRALTAELTRELAVTPAATRDCDDDAIDPEDPDRSLQRVRASTDVLARIRSAHAQRTLVMEIATRLICPRNGRSAIEARCVEDDVALSVLVLDEEGRPIHVAGLAVEEAERARSAVSSVLGTFARGAPGSAGVGGACRWTDAVLDCT